MNEQLIIDNIIEELENKRDITINKMKKTLLKDEMLRYSEEEDGVTLTMISSVFSVSLGGI